MPEKKDVVCTIRFQSDDDIAYQDTLPKQDMTPARGRIDRNSLSWRTAEVLSAWVRDSADQIRRTELELLGRHLYQVIFADGKIRGLFEVAYKTCAEFQLRLKVELQFTPDARSVAELPWEFLHMPDELGGFFLAGERDKIQLIRLAVRADQDTQEVEITERPLRVLVATCSPDTAIDVQQILAAVRALSSADAIEVTPLPDPTFDQLLQTVSQPRLGPHVLHIVGHGQAGGMLMRRAASPGADAKAEARRLAGLGEPQNGRVFVDAETVTSLFRMHRPHLVFLHSCDGDAPSLTSVYSTARAIVYSSVPAVVAMQYEISAGAAIRFVDQFYRELAEGRSVGEAVTAGRCDLARGSEETGIRRDWANRMFGTPVAYLCRDAPLVNSPLAAGGPGSFVPGLPPPTARLACPRCGVAQGEAARSCGKCGLQLVCDRCGARYGQPATSRFCSNCGVQVTQVPWSGRPEAASAPDRLYLQGSQEVTA